MYNKSRTQAFLESNNRTFIERAIERFQPFVTE